jgi:hypothetical protein
VHPHIAAGRMHRIEDALIAAIEIKRSGRTED